MPDVENTVIEFSEELRAEFADSLNPDLPLAERLAVGGRFVREHCSDLQLGALALSFFGNLEDQMLGGYFTHTGPDPKDLN